MATVLDEYHAGWDRSRYDLGQVSTYSSRHVPAYRKAAELGAALVEAVLEFSLSKPDVVHVHVSFRGSIYRKSLFVALARAFGIRALVLHFHAGGFPDFLDDSSPLVRAFVHQVVSGADHLVGVSQALTDELSRRFPGHSVTTLRNPLPLDDAAQNAPRDGSSSDPPGADDRFVVLSLGDISEEKGVFDTVEAVPQVVAECPRAEFWFAGRGDTDRLDRRATEEPWGDRIRVLGWVDGEQKKEVLNRADLLLLPSHAEGLPMSILEGMAHGLPIVASRVGGIPEVITDGEEGLLIEPGEPESIAAAVLRFAEDPAFSRRAGAAGRDRVQREFRRDRILDSLYGLYGRLLPEQERSHQTAAREA